MRTLICGLVACAMLPGCEKTDSGTPQSVTVPRAGNGHGVNSDPDTPCYRESWYKNGQKRSEGACVCVFHNGECTTGTSDGLQTYWYKSGQKQGEHSYDDGVPYGMWTTWYESGQMQWEQSYDDGVYAGITRTWTEDGTLTACVCFVDGDYTWSDLEQCDTRPCPDPDLAAAP